MLLSGHDTQGGITNFIGSLRAGLEAGGQTCRSAALYQAFISQPGAYEQVLVCKRQMSPLDYAGAVFRLLRLVLRERPAAVVTVMPLAGVAAGLVSLLTGTPVIVTHHSPYRDNGRIVRWLDRMVGGLGGYRQIVCVSQAVADSFAGHSKACRAPLRVIANGVAEVPPAMGRAQCFARFGLPADRSVVLMAGRLARQKNVLTAVKAVARLEGIALALAGDGPLREEVRQLAQQLGVAERVHLLGHLDHHDVVDLTFACDAFVQISFFEGQSLALLDAVRAGTPIVVSDIAVQREVIKTPIGELAGVTCDPQDADDVARAIAELLRDPARHQQLRAQLASRVRSEAQMVADYRELLQPLLGQQAHSSVAWEGATR